MKYQRNLFREKTPNGINYDYNRTEEDKRDVGVRDNTRVRDGSTDEDEICSPKFCGLINYDCPAPNRTPTTPKPPTTFLKRTQPRSPQPFEPSPLRSPLNSANRSPLNSANRSPLNSANRSPLNSANRSPNNRSLGSPLNILIGKLAIDSPKYESVPVTPNQRNHSDSTIPEKMHPNVTASHRNKLSSTPTNRMHSSVMPNNQNSSNSSPRHQINSRVTSKFENKSSPTPTNRIHSSITPDNQKYLSPTHRTHSGVTSNDHDRAPVQSLFANGSGDLTSLTNSGAASPKRNPCSPFAAITPAITPATTPAITPVSSVASPQCIYLSDDSEFSTIQSTRFIGPEYAEYTRIGKSSSTM